jgi:hypothetical protein
MAQSDNALSFIESAVLPGQPGGLEAKTEGVEAEGGIAPGLNLNRLPDGVVSGNTLIDYSSVSSPELRSGISLAMLFAGQAATGAQKEGDDEDDWLAAYKTNLAKLGFSVAQSAVTSSRFRKNGVFVHQAIIPFLTIAFGGAGLGPVILAALSNLKDMDKDRPWVTLFDRESRRFQSRELFFAAVSSDAANTSVRHVMARLSYVSTTTNVLFFKVTDAQADFESATTTMTANNSLLAVLEPVLRKKMETAMFNFIADVTLPAKA